MPTGARAGWRPTTSSRSFTTHCVSGKERRGMRIGLGGMVGVLLLAGAAGAQDAHQHGEPGRLGTVKFSNSCREDVQPAFARGMALLHSFEFGTAIDAFADVVRRDPSCGVALWGTGLAQWGNPFSVAIRPSAQTQSGRATLERAAAIGAKTARDRDYIAAAAAVFDPFETVDQVTRMRAYRDAVQPLSAKYPDDHRAAAFYALA